MRARPFGLRAAALGLALATAYPGLADAQRRTQLNITNFPRVVTTTSATDFDAGSVSLGTTAFTVEGTSNFPAFSPRETTVQVQCVAGQCPNTGALPVGNLQWRRDDLGTWNTLTTSYVTIETRDLVYNGANDPWGNTLHWRYLVSWTGTPPQVETRWRVRFRLVVAPP